VVIVGRGDVFNVPIEKGVTRNLTRTSGAHDKHARWSPDGRKIAFISDRTGEEEIWLIDALGSGKPEQLTSGGKAMRYVPEWSPDGKRLAFGDKDRNLWVLTVADKKLTLAAHDARREIRDYAWSPGSDYLAFSMLDPNNFRSIWIWGVDGKLHRVTDEDFFEFQPAWDPQANICITWRAAPTRRISTTSTSTSPSIATSASTPWPSERRWRIPSHRRRTR
jgi:tricorn protease